MLKPLSLAKLKKEDSINKIIISYDIESTVIEENNKMRHVANLLIASKFSFVLLLIKSNYFYFIFQISFVIFVGI
jgi:hypothetical protein